MTTYTIFIVRHGTTEWIEQGRIHGGALDSPLSPFGQWEAQQTANFLADQHITRIYSSPQGRAMQTATAIAQKFPSMPITKLDGLREIGFGKMEGKRNNFRKVRRNPIVSFFTVPLWSTMRGLTGESKNTLRKRILKAWEQILAESPSGNIVIVSHSGTINTLLTALPCAEEVQKKKRNHVGTCSISRVEMDENGHPLIVAIGDVSHLEGGHPHAH